MSEWIRVSKRLPDGCFPVLAFYVNHYGKKRVVRASYARKFQLLAGEDADGSWADWNQEDEEYYCPEGWYEDNENEETHWQVTDPVTHWMFLPEPPCCNAQHGDYLCDKHAGHAGLHRGGNAGGAGAEWGDNP